MTSSRNFGFNRKHNNYIEINGKIKKDVENNILFLVIRGICETISNTNGHLLTSYIWTIIFIFSEDLDEEGTRLVRFDVIKGIAYNMI